MSLSLCLFFQYFAKKEMDEDSVYPIYVRTSFLQTNVIIVENATQFFSITACLELRIYFCLFECHLKYNLLFETTLSYLQTEALKLVEYFTRNS